MTVTIAQARKRMQTRSRLFKGEDRLIYIELSATAIDEISTNFQKGGRPTWKARKQVYSHPILNKTGKMMDTTLASCQPTRWNLRNNPKVLKIMSTGYGHYHQYGSKHLPARPFVKFSRRGIQDMKQHFYQAFRKPL